YLSNKSEGIKVCLLADLKSATQKVLPEDEKNIKLAKKMIDELNEKKDVFSLLLRQRKYSKTQNEYTGYDRKRGAITELIRAIKGDKSGFIVMHGNISKLNSTKYIMALDADTELSFDAIKKLISAATHPQNKPQIDYEKGIVKSGYAIFVPRVETDLKSAYETGFTRVMAGAGGIGHYSSACGERYQDLFGQSIFSGKGLIDVDAFYLLLNDRFKDETILSHDILEGEFLRTAFIGNAVVTDSFPENEISYFKRQSRWIRGDWQNLNFIFKKVNFKNGKKQNPLPFISKFKLFDNLRRSLLPTFSLILILVSAFLPYNAMLITSITGILSIAINEILAGVTDLFFTRGRGFYSIFYGDAIPNALKKLLEAIVNIVMLPKAAIVSINAVLKGIYRRFISHKNMLEWVTAAQSEHDNKNFSLIKNSFSSVVCFLILLIFGGHFHLFIGLFFLSNTLLLTLSAKKSKENTKDFTFLEREKLIEDAKKMWNYYEKYCNEKSNFLPPDNVQKEPIFRIAERTSPTNIGMMLCSCLAARDFLFISTEELYTIIKKSLDSIEKLEKWNGNLLNWYSTADLKPLNPIYVSTVDSGNFLCCLVALKQGMLEYANENPKLFDLINRVDGIIKSTNLKVLYNKNRRLFHIGYDLDKNELTNSYYDLLMSEARMTSYFAVSQRQVPSEHWAALSRMQARYKSYCGSVSWTGTMFEYFMPNLFIPSFKNSNTYESLKFCMLCQKNRTRKKHIPWGISESAFYKLDAQMNYQYKAHGVGKLALNRYVNSELVISPYSSYLCLEFDKKAAFNNIKHLKKLDVSSDCGLFEAIDFTSSRTQSRDFKAVQSYMAHHIGMSIIGILNAVKGDIMQKRFMRDENSMAAKSLLTESVINDKPLKNIDLKETPSRPKREDANKIVFENPTPTSPNVGVLSNGEWTTIVSDLGTGHSIYQLVNATRESREIIRQPMGIFAFVKTKSESIPLCKALDYKNKQSFKFKSLADRLILTTQGKTINSQTTVTVNARFPSEMREY
ncbi:MAG: glucoamylase family protein, partial [Oscillospiraceae bacterium]